MEYIRINKLRVKSSTGNTLREPTEVRLGSTKKYRLMNGDDVVWDVLQTTFSASNFSIGANGGNVASNSSVTSYGLNALGTKESLDWTCSPTTIAANSSTSPKTHTITYTQTDTGDTTTATCTQAVQSITVTGYRYSASVSSESIGDAEASGSTLSLKVSGTITVYEQYSNGSESYYTSYSFGSTTATITSGTDQNSLAYLSGGKVVVKSAGTNTYSGYRIVYYIYGYSFSVDGRSYSNSSHITIYQKENKVTGTEWGTSSSDYTLSASSNVAKFTSSGGTATISVTCQQRYRYTYTSTSKSDWAWGNGTATLSTSYGSLSGSSVTGTGSVTLTVGKDQGNGYTAVITISTGGNHKTTISIAQTKRVKKSTDYGTPVGTTSPISTVAVTGGMVYLKIASWTQSYTITYDNGTKSTGSTSGTNASATVTNGSGINGTKIESGGVSIPNAGTNYYTTDRTAYTITGYSFTANGKTANVPTSIAIKQKANNRKETTEYYVGLVSQSTTTIGNTGGTFTFTAESLKRTKYTYDTNQTAYSTYSNYSASVTYSNGVIKVSSSTISGKQTVTVTVGSNYDNVKTPKVVVTSQGDSSKSISITVTQAAAVYDFYFVDPGTIGAYGGTYDITLISKVNGSFMTVIPESVKLSGGTVNKITENASGSKYNVNVTFPANSSTTNTESYVIQAQQMNTGKTTSLTIIQAKKTSSYVTGHVSISSLISGLYISSDGILGGFNQYPTFTITASSNGWVNDCKYMFCLDFKIELSNGQTFNPRYEHQLDYIEFSAFSGTKTVQFINFPTNFNLQDLTDYQFNPYYLNVVSVRIIADIQPVTSENMGLLMLSQNYIWTVN